MTKATLFIVEDDAILAANLEIILTGLGYRVLGLVATGEEAIAFLGEQSVDLVLMDIELTGTMNGIIAAEIINRTADIPIVFLTGFSHDPLLEQAKSVAPYGYLIKPVQERELAATIAMSLHRHALDRQLRESRLALAESEARYRHLFENSPLGIFRTSLDGKALLLNEEMVKMLGFDSATEAIGACTDMGPQVYVDPARREEFVSLLRTQGEVRHFEYQARKRNGEIIWITMDARLTRVEAVDGAPSEQVIDGFARDITESKRTEQQVRASRDFLHTVLNAIPVRVFWKDLDLRYLGCNLAFAQDAGCNAPDELIGKDDFALTWRDQASLYQSDDRDVITHGIPKMQFEEEQTTPSGEQLHLLTSKLPLKNAEGVIFGILGVYADITERKRAEEGIRQRELFLRTLLGTTADGFWVIDASGSVTEVNDAYCAMSGYSREELVGRHINEIDAEEQPEQTKARIRRIMARGRELFETRHRRKDGSLFPVEVSVTFLAEQGGQFVCFCRDLSERILLEEERRQLQAQLQHAQKMEAIGTLAGGIAHDFNNILGAVIGYAELAREDSLPGSAIARDLDRVLEAANRAASLVKQILAFSRQQESKRILFDPSLIVKEVIKLLHPSLPSTIAIKHRITSSRCVIADPTQLHQVLMNLATNAFHAMEETGGRLEIAIEDIDCSEADLAFHPGIIPGPFVRLSVADTGPGIGPEIRERIFDPYFTTKEVGKGTGMGLAIVDGIVRGSGGFITCESEPGKGTVFAISLPTCAGEVPGTDEEAEPVTTGSGRVLLVDDEMVLLEIGQTMLERLGYSVTVRTSSLEALTTFQNDPHCFDVVITDQTMPGMTGIDLARRMLQIRPDIPIILCTGYSSLISEEKAKSLGIQGFAMKPVTGKELGALMRKVLRPS